ncbi:MAG: DUF5060 domain-containing protein [Rubripirellula sp.]
MPGVGEASDPIVDDQVTFVEKDGLLAVEAEHFFKQSKSDKRAFHLTTADHEPGIQPDGDPSHVAGASGGAYLEILPDTRRTHGDKLIRGVNFAPEAGQMAVLHYNVSVSTPGRYYVWARAHSTGSEDNGLHVGIDGEWPETGQRLQWCQGKKTWRWDSNQRTEQQHCGEPHKIYLDIEQPGEHTIHFSMREDGFEFDKWLMTTDREFTRPDDVGPESVAEGKLPKSFRFVVQKPSYPAHWGEPPMIQTQDIRPLPGGYGQGSSTLANWIQQNLDKDAADGAQSSVGLQMPATMFAKTDKKNYYLDRDQWLAVNPEQHKSGEASRTFPYPTGVYDLTLQAVGESDGKSSYTVSVDGDQVGDFVCPLSKQMFEEGDAFNKTWKQVPITEGAIITVTSEIGSTDGQEFSRARWAGVTFTPANKATRKAAAPMIAKQAAAAKSNSQGQEKKSQKSSPTKSVSDLPLTQPREADGDGSIKVSGDLKTWHKVTLTMNGPFAHEQDNEPNPFTDYRLSVDFSHNDGTKYTIPGFFAADGDAANSSADAGTQWRCHFAPDRTGQWNYKVSFVRGTDTALTGKAGEPVTLLDGKSGSLEIAASEKSGRDLRAHGRLQYVGKHYLQFAGSGEYFLKAGADAPETLLAFADFDNTIAGNARKAPIKQWKAHVDDWQQGDPTWKNGKGKGLIGAISYLSGKGCNAFSFLTYNAGGDGDNVWPFIQRDDKLHYDCSKLDQWGIVFDHGTQKGMYLHFKMQETENDDHQRGKGGGNVPESLDGGNLGPQRMLYCREMIARFGHNLALNWNLGEENTQTTAQQLAMIDYIADLDAYDHNIVIHTYPSQQDQVYRPLLGEKSKLTGVSLQNSSLETTHAQTLKWVRASADAGKPWVVAFDESGSAAHAQCPDLGYRGFDGRDRSGKMVYTEHKVRKQTLWGTLMAGGAGCEYYFGYQFDENDIICEDWRSRDRSWDYCRHAITFFHENEIPFWEMVNMDERVGNPKHGVSKFCFAKPDELYLVYLPEGGESSIDLADVKGDYSLEWFNPREGGTLQRGSVRQVDGGGSHSLGLPPSDTDEDWLAVIRRKS